MSNTGVAAPTVGLTGIDVSHHQGDVDWSAAARTGIAFAFIKATDGDVFLDPRFNMNWAGMKDAGVVRGAYHFFRPAKDVQAQVETFVTAIGEIADGDLPPVLDLEEALNSAKQDEWDSIPGPQRVPLVLDWLQTVERQLGRKPIIYTRRGFVASKLPNATPLSEYLLWIAHYTNQPAPSIPSNWATWTFWQFSEKGTTDGIVGNVDLDRFNGLAEDLAALAADPNKS